jgi:hypothetical protein
VVITSTSVGGNGITFNTHGLQYVTIDGQVTNGIKVNYPNEGRGVNILKKADFIQLFNLELVGPAGDSDHNGYPETKSTRGILAYAYENWGTGVWHTEPIYNLYVKNCNIHGASTLIYTHTAHNTIVEGCSLYDSRYDPSVAGPAAVHANVFYTSYSNYGTFKNNRVWNWEAEGLFFNYEGQTGWKIYGNVFIGGNTVDSGVETMFGYVHGRHEFYNNPFVDFWTSVRLEGVSGGNVKNNLFYNAPPTTFGAASRSYNWYYGSGTWSETGMQNGTGSPFVNSSNKDYRLAVPTQAGDTLIEETYQTDFFGNPRGADGAWDRGAFEFSSTNTIRPAAPSNLSVN